MNSIQEINRINQRELDLGLSGNASWHYQYKDSAYVHVGGLSYEMTEGDVIAVMSQFGEIMDINMPRDKESGKPRGFAFLMYEDQRSTILAVDNLNGAVVLGRTLKVDHVHKYEQPGKRDEEGKYHKPDEPTYNAMPPELSGSDYSSDSDSSAAGEKDELDAEDPMAAFLLAEKKKNKPRKLRSGRDDAEKEEKRRRKEERARIREERERRRRMKDQDKGKEKGKGKEVKREMETDRDHERARGREGERDGYDRDGYARNGRGGHLQSKVPAQDERRDRARPISSDARRDRRSSSRSGDRDRNGSPQRYRRRSTSRSPPPPPRRLDGEPRYDRERGSNRDPSGRLGENGRRDEFGARSGHGAGYGGRDRDDRYSNDRR